MEELRYGRIATTAERLRQIMDERGLRQIDIVNATGISRSKISSYLSGAYSPKSDKIVPLARYLNVSEAWLWGFDVPKERTPEQQKDDKLSDLVIRIRTDNRFADTALKLLKLTPDQLLSIDVLLTTFTKEIENKENQ